MKIGNKIFERSWQIQTGKITGTIGCIQTVVKATRSDSLRLICSEGELSPGPATTQAYNICCSCRARRGAAGGGPARRVVRATSLQRHGDDHSPRRMDCQPRGLTRITRKSPAIGVRSASRHRTTSPKRRKSARSDARTTSWMRADSPVVVCRSECAMQRLKPTFPTS